jgi:hypothetical protein
MCFGPPVVHHHARATTTECAPFMSRVGSTPPLPPTLRLSSLRHVFKHAPSYLHMSGGQRLWQGGRRVGGRAESRRAGAFYLPGLPLRACSSGVGAYTCLSTKLSISRLIVLTVSMKGRVIGFEAGNREKGWEGREERDREGEGGGRLEPTGIGVHKEVCLV